MTSRALCLSLVLFVCLRVQAQEFVGTPLNVSYATLLDWVIAPGSNKVTMSAWIEGELVRHALPEQRAFARSVKVTLQGHSPAVPCDSVRAFAWSRSAPDKRPEMVFCIRTVQYLEQISRTWQLHALNEISDEYPHRGRRTKILDRYLGYLVRRMNEDRDLADDPHRFRPFCSVEFYILVNALGFFGNECPQEAVVKHQTEFNRFFWQGEFFPEAVLKAIPVEQRQDAVLRYVQATQTSGWRGLWRAAALHEFGHLVLCHQGAFPGLRCENQHFDPASLRSLHGERQEAQADGYVLSRLVDANAGDVDKILATASALIIHNLTRSIWNGGDDLRFDRLVMLQGVYKRLFRNAFSTPEMASVLSQLDAGTRKAIDDSLK
jgi:hypothetical protein